MKLICYSFSEKTRRIRANDHHINAMEGFARRHRSDNQINNRETKTVVEHELVTRKWKDIKVGDMVRLENNEFITADIVLISTSEHNGLCYIETAELDGETNLKKRFIGLLYLEYNDIKCSIQGKLYGYVMDEVGNEIQDLEKLAMDGLRKLCLAYKELNETDYKRWAQRLHAA
ncbi:unnamed protein product, partial [Rotaria sp. Silwood2]